jgi:hypothetical protein
MFSLGLEIAFAVLLVTTIGYSIALNRKLGNLRQHKEDLERLAMTFSQSTVRAEEGVQRLKSSTVQMQKSIAKAQTMREDLALLIDRGSLAADRLEESVRGIRSKTLETKPSTLRNLVEPDETVSDEVSARRASEFGGIKNANEPDIGNIEEGLDEQKSQAEKDLIEALRQAR